jgi:hypothetical protein
MNPKVGLSVGFLFQETLTIQEFELGAEDRSPYGLNPLFQSFFDVVLVGS